MTDKVAVVAVGGNALIKDINHQTVEDQYATAGETCEHIADQPPKPQSSLPTKKTLITTVIRVFFT